MVMFLIAMTFGWAFMADHRMTKRQAAWDRNWLKLDEFGRTVN